MKHMKEDNNRRRRLTEGLLVGLAVQKQEEACTERVAGPWLVTRCIDYETMVGDKVRVPVSRRTTFPAQSRHSAMMPLMGGSAAVLGGAPRVVACQKSVQSVVMCLGTREKLFVVVLLLLLLVFCIR